MAITDAGQICESTALTTTTRMTLSGASKAGALMAMGLGGRVSSGLLDIVGITDSQGNAWDWFGQESGYRAAFVAWAKASAAMVSATDWIEVQWSRTPQAAWMSGHSFEGAGGTPTDTGLAQGSPTTAAAKTISVAGSDFLVLATVAYAYSTTTTTPLNSMTEQDTFLGGTAPNEVALEFLSRNHTSGSTFQTGTSFAASRYWTIAAVSFPFEAMPAGRGAFGLLGV